MKTGLSIQLLDAFAKPGKSTCFLVKLKSKRTGQVYGFTTLDAAMQFYDYQDDVLYRAFNVLQPQNIQHTWDVSDPDNTELHGWFDEVVAAAFTAGMLDNAELTIYRVAYNHLDQGAEIVAFGTVGRAEFSANKQGSRKVEFRGLSDALLRKVMPVFSITCRNAYGDNRCKKAFVWEGGTVASVANKRVSFQLSGITQPADYYNFGVLKFLDGANANFEAEIEQWNADGSLKLSFLTPYPVAMGAAVELRIDCDKLAATCIARSNIVNFNGEHLTPVQDQSLMVPGAYIKSSNAL